MRTAKGLNQRGQQKDSIQEKSKRTVLSRTAKNQQGDSKRNVLSRNQQEAGKKTARGEREESKKTARGQQAKAQHESG
jgi:hypothetical protein